MRLWQRRTTMMSGGEKKRGANETGIRHFKSAKAKIPSDNVRADHIVDIVTSLPCQHKRERKATRITSCVKRACLFQ